MLLLGPKEPERLNQVEMFFRAGHGRSARPAIIQVLDDPLAAVLFSDAILAAQTGQNNADLPRLRRRSTPFHLA